MWYNRKMMKISGWIKNGTISVTEERKLRKGL